MKQYLANALQTKAVAQSHGISAQKRYGQNFLIDPAVPERIVEAAGIGPDDFVLEIGPGIGTLTQYLAEAAGRVTAVEIDRNLLPVLADTLSFWDNVTIRCGDILKTDLQALADEENGGRPMKVVSNLPYYITTPILMMLLESSAPISSVTAMMQEEVADRICASPGSRIYGALSPAVQYFAEPVTVMRVPPSAFLPQPGVSSVVLHLARRKEPAVKTADRERLFAVIRAAFLQRRKTLPNALAGYAPLGVSREAAAAALEKMGLSPQLRGEMLSLEEFARLSDLLIPAHTKNGEQTT